MCPAWLGGGESGLVLGVAATQIGRHRDIISFGWASRMFFM